MVFNEGKRYFVDRRVIDRMSATGSATFASYFARLRSDLQNEVEQFINAFTINETYFYREDQQLRCLTSDLLDDRVRLKKRGEPIRIWSVPCSTGEEPFSIAIWILENWPRADAHDIEIVGSDIDTKVLEVAREGIFGKRSLMRLTPDLIEKYFVPIDPELARVDPADVGEPGGRVADAHAWQVRRDFLPERSHLFRRRFAPRGGRKSLREPRARRIYLPGPHRVDE
jgi:chemotaxis protein methyltransferase CheR